MAATKLYHLLTGAYGCEQLIYYSCYLTAT